MKRVMLFAGALLLIAPLKGALAHDDGYYMPYFQHQMDHLEHQGLHQELGEAHDEAHAYGFRDGHEHRDWHRAYGATHENFHEEHPQTWHDHQNPYEGSGAYNYYGYRPSYGFSWSFGR